MIVNNFDIFPTKLIQFDFMKEEISPLIDEVISKKKLIKSYSQIYSSLGGEGVYHSDYKNPVKLPEYEKLMIMVGNYFVNQNYFFKVNEYWTAFYGPKGRHVAHRHVRSLEHRSTNNYSSIFYLTEEGSTRFLSPNPTSLVEVFTSFSKVGRFMIFPSSLFHDTVPPKSEERIIISSNLEIYKNV
tara:strand:+ start:423 stop:977 length:555 start_codon:yes stop_codon:yes gene_type:complete